MALGWVEKQCVFCMKGKGEEVRCPNDVKMMVVDFEPCIECQKKHEGKVVVGEALAEDTITGRFHVMTREEANKMLIPDYVQYALIDEESFCALFTGENDDSN